MSLTDQEFRVRKLRTCFAGMDVDNDGYITTDDFKEMARRFVAYGKLDEKQGKDITKAILDIGDVIGVKEGDKVTLEQYLAGAVKLCEDPLGPDYTRPLMRVLFDAVDVNHDGVISTEEFRLYFKCIGINEAHAKASFDGIDANRDGLITKEEFLAAAIEFFYGFNATSGATLFYGPLVD